MMVAPTLRLTHRAALMMLDAAVEETKDLAEVVAEALA